MTVLFNICRPYGSKAAKSREELALLLVFARFRLRAWMNRDLDLGLTLLLLGYG
jgi:hypothetical protein